MGRKSGPGRGDDHYPLLQLCCWLCLLLIGQGGITPDKLLEFCRPHSLLIFPEGAEQWHVVYGPGVRTGNRIGLLSYAVSVLILSLVVTVAVPNSGVPDVAAEVLIGIDVVIQEAVPKDQVVSILIHPYSVLVPRGIIGIGGIILAAFGDLQAIVVAPGDISNNQVVAAVLLQGEADAEACYDLSPAVIDEKVVSYIIITGPVCHQDAIVVMIDPVSSHLIVGGIPQRGRRCTPISDYHPQLPLPLSEEDPDIGVIYNAAVFDCYIPGALDIKPNFRQSIMLQPGDIEAFPHEGIGPYRSRPICSL